MVMLLHRNSQYMSLTLKSEQGFRSASDKYPLLQTVIRSLNRLVSSPQITTAGRSRRKQTKSLKYTGLWGLKKNLQTCSEMCLNCKQVTVLLCLQTSHSLISESMYFLTSFKGQRVIFKARICVGAFQFLDSLGLPKAIVQINIHWKKYTKSTTLPLSY